MSNTTPESSIEERKLAIEEKKLAIAKKTFNTDLVAKIAIPAVVAIIALMTYWKNTNTVNDRTAQMQTPQIRNSTPQITQTSGLSATPTLDSYKADGRQFVKIRRFDPALDKFAAATVLSPTDAEAWNFKAYTEMRLGNSSEALKSINTSINLRPVDIILQHRVILNATKILCTLRRTDEAASYLEKSIVEFPSVSAEVRKDGELSQLCHF